MTKAKELTAPSPLDELRIPVDKVWEKILGKDQPTDDELLVIVQYERAAMAAHLVEDEVKRNKREK